MRRATTTSGAARTAGRAPQSGPTTTTHGHGSLEAKA